MTTTLNRTSIRSTTIRATLITLTLYALLLALAAGCAGGKKQSASAGGAGITANPSVTDITPPPASPTAYAPPAGGYSAPAQPAVYDTPVAPAATPGAAAGGRYTVQKGDTLWKIASNTYGDGKQWQRIAAANPGLSPETLKAGQTITIP